MSRLRVGNFDSPTLDDPLLAEMVRRLVEAYRPERIFLFCSVGRGDAGPDSDYDPMVVVGDDAPQELRGSRPGYRAPSHRAATVTEARQRR